MTDNKIGISPIRFILLALSGMFGAYVASQLAFNLRVSISDLDSNYTPLTMAGIGAIILSLLLAIALVIKKRNVATDLVSFVVYILAMSLIAFGIAVLTLQPSQIIIIR